MIGQSLVAREAEVLNLLGALHERREKFALIGGYAVDAYSALPRFSVECDLVIADDQLWAFSELLHELGYRQGSTYQNELKGVETRRFVKKVGGDPVFVDLLVGGVRCRQTEAVWKEEEVRRTLKELRVVGVNGSVLSNVASKEMLIAMKLHSGRDPDLRDMVMLAAGADWKAVGDLSRRGSKKKVIVQIESAVDIIGRREFDQRLRAYFGLKNNASRRVGSVLSRLSRLLKDVKNKNSPWTSETPPVL